MQCCLLMEINQSVSAFIRLQLTRLILVVMRMRTAHGEIRLYDIIRSSLGSGEKRSCSKVRDID